MPGSIFVLRDDDTLVEMKETPYDSEAVLQGLVANYSNLLAGDQIDPDNPRALAAVHEGDERVMGDESTDRGYLDHLFLDQDAVPTLVEVKRSENTQIRREVVGQMLDYAANGVAFWSVEDIRSRYEDTCRRQGVDPDQRLRECLALTTRRTATGRGSRQTSRLVGSGSSSSLTKYHLACGGSWSF